MMKQVRKKICYCLVFLAASCTSHTTETGHVEKPVDEMKVSVNAEQARNAGIVTESMKEKDLAGTIRVNGRIDVPPQNLYSVSVPMGGFLKSTKLLPGMHFNKGEVIAVMEDQQYIQLQQDYLTARSRMKYLESEFNRQKELNKTKAISDREYEEAQSNFSSQKVLLKSLGEKLRLLGLRPESLDENSISRQINIYAPFDGYVSRVNVNIGKYVNPPDILFELVNPEDIHLNLTVFEKDIMHLAIGQKVLAYTNSEPGKKYECEIILIGKDIAGDRHIEVHCHFMSYDKSLIPGMYMNADIQVAGKKAGVLPEDAVVHFDGKDYVFIEAAKGDYALTPVETGMREHSEVEIVTGLPQDARIVTKGAYTLLMIMKNKEE